MAPSPSMLSASSLLITGGIYTQYNVTNTVLGTKGPMDRLQEATAPNAFHNSGERRDPSKCHPNTRVAILEKIKLWIVTYTSNPGARDRLIMWLYGPAGAGKSAIAQSIADLCYDDKLLLASFFFSRFDETRNHARSLIPTISYQVAEHFPETRESILSHIERDPLIFARSLEAQIVSLVLNPLQPLIDSGYFRSGNCRRLVLIDGLDECKEREAQLDILKAITNTLKKHDLPFLFFIASRPEHDLKEGFRSGHLQEISTLLPLDDEYQSYADVELFLRDKFRELKATHPFRSHIPTYWPSEDIIRKLIYKSSGQFIYAATVVKFIASNRHRPTDRLDIILGLQPPNRDLPFAELDALYMHIFTSLEDPTLALHLIASQFLLPIHYRPDPDNIGDMEVLMSLKPGDVEISLCDLSSVLEVQTSPLLSRGRSLRIFHASLEDFLFDKTRSGQFHIDAPYRHTQLAHLHLQYQRNRYSGPHDPSCDENLSRLADLAYHLTKALPTPSLRDDIVKLFDNGFSEELKQSILAANATVTKLDVICLFQAVKNMDFEDAQNLHDLCSQQVFGILPDLRFYSGIV